MQAAWLTDIHLNFLKQDQINNFLHTLLKEPVDCFFMSGDIGEADSIIDYLKQVELVLDRPFYFVLGNHDFYNGSIKTVRSVVSDFVKTSDKLVWLNEVDYVSLTEETALIGHDSWADGRLGNFFRSSVELNDFHLIEELKLLDRDGRLKVMQELANEAVEHFKKVLPQALKYHQHIIVLTHVPPFKKACWHQGQISGDDWLPFFSCESVGDVLKSIMEQHPACEMTVFCGHTHSSGECQILPNLKVLTGKAKYGSPEIQKYMEKVKGDIKGNKKEFVSFCPEKQQIIQKLKDVDSQIDILVNLRKKLLSELDCVATNNTSNQKVTQPTSILIKEEKIQLFKSLFRGRDDVYAHLWISKKTGKKGYSPVCRNEWVANVCKKPKMGKSAYLAYYKGLRK